MNKKILSLVIALVLVLGSVTTVFAGNFDLIHKLDSRKNTAMLELMEDLDVYDQVFEDFANYELEYESKKYALVDIQEKLDAGADGLQEAIEQIDKGEEPSGGLEVVEVSAINSTAIKVVFNQKVDKTSAEKLENYYVGIGESKVSDSSIAHNNSTNYKAVLVDDNTVVISANTDPKHVIWVDKNSNDVIPGAVALKVNATDSVVKNKTVTIQVRNVKTAAGKLMDTQEKSFYSVDTEPAKIYGTEVVKGKTVPTNNNVTEVVVTSDQDVIFMFDEPVFLNTGVKKAEFYLDSKNITTHVSLDVADPSGRTLKVAKEAGIKDLTLGNHKFEAVGVEDLAGNKPVGDIYYAVIEVVEPTEPTDPTETAPAVKSVKQIAEGQFEITFAAAPKADTKIVVKDSERNTVVDNETMLSDGITAAVSISGTKATVEFAEKMVDYKGSTKLIYTVEVTGADGGKIEPATGSKKADKYSKIHTFNLDLIAPEVVYSTVDADGKAVETKFVDDTTKTQLVIPFADKPFAGPVVKGTSANAVILKQHIDEETKSLTIPFVDINALVSNKLTIDIATLGNASGTADEKALAAAAKAMLNKDGDALLAGNYELILPRGLVVDTNTKRLSDNTTIIPFVGDTIRFEILADEDNDDVTPSVPQTAQDLVKYDKDHDAIIVEFVGEDIKVSTAKNPANYTLAGNKLAANTYIEYETLKDGTGKVTGGEARIFLNKDTIVRDGNYTLRVEGVSTNSGAKMLPVTVTVTEMKDNTRPVLESAVITGDAKLELRFSESVDIKAGDENLAAGNFEVLVNGAVYTVREANVLPTDTKLVILELRDIVDYEGKTVVIRTKADNNNDYFVRDLGGNELKAEVIVTATPLGK